MSQFEYISIPVSLILTFGVARLLSGFQYLFTNRRTYWVHTLWCIQAILNYLLFWWLHWNTQSIEEWTLGTYLLTLVYPSICYVGATVFMPSDASTETDWHAHFFAARKWIFGIAAVATVTLIVTGLTFGRIPLMSPGVFVTLGLVGIYVVGLVSASERVHAVIVLVNGTFIVAAYAPLIYRPVGG